MMQVSRWLDNEWSYQQTAAGWLYMVTHQWTCVIGHNTHEVCRAIYMMVSYMRMYNECSCPPKHPLVFVSWSDLPVCTNLLYQPAFGLWPAVLDPVKDFGSSSTESSYG